MSPFAVGILDSCKLIARSGRPCRWRQRGGEEGEEGGDDPTSSLAAIVPVIVEAWKLVAFLGGPRLRGLVGGRVDGNDCNDDDSCCLDFAGAVDVSCICKL